MAEVEASTPPDQDAPAPPQDGLQFPGQVTDSEAAQPPLNVADLQARLNKVIYSDIGITTLLTRLKQSVASAKDFATFLKKRAALEEEHAQGLRKLSRSIHDAAHRPENRQGSFSQAYDAMHRIHDRMSDHSMQFAVSLQQMAEDLNEHASTIERGRKQWKQTGLSMEKKAQEAETVAGKAKAKYDSLSEQYDRVHTGDKQAGKFGLKGHKSAAQHEEDLLRKVQNADSDYVSKVQAAQATRQELVSIHRPQAVTNIQKLTVECDSALVMQLQKYATFYEKLLLGQGLCVSPLNVDSANGTVPTRSMRDIITEIDNAADFHNFVLSYEGSAVTSEEVKYERHPALSSAPTASAPASPQNSHNKRHSFSLTSTFQSQAAALVQPIPQGSMQTAKNTQHIPSNDTSQNGAQQYKLPPPYVATSQGPPITQSSNKAQNPQMQSPISAELAPMSDLQQHLPPLRPVFGISLDDLYRRDGNAVPLVVYQCFQAIELFGLDSEGIYRLSGNIQHIARLKALFDNDASKVDFTNPENFYHDVHSVAGLLKQFFRDLPDPLISTAAYSDFVNAARITDDIQRRDSLHALVNNLPDANYATLRALILHLNKIQENYARNRMNAGNIAICFGPTLMGANSGGNIADAGWQVRVIETILANTFQIFDDD